MKSEPVHLLLVEDNPGDARLFLEMLRAGALEFELSHVERVGEALDHLDHEPVDVLLLDLSLPDSTGLETIVRVQQRAAGVPIIVLTGTDDDVLAIKTVQMGAQDYLRKGETDSVSLVRCIRYAMERKRAEIAERERKTLQEAVQAMEQVLGVVGHELRTPLAALRATSEFLLTEDARETDEWDVFLRSINDEVIRMTNMVNDLLEAARLNSGTAQWNWSRVRLEEVCQAAVDQIRPLVDPGKIHLESLVEPSTLTMMGDEDAIRRLVLNLLSNAHKHTKEGSIRVVARVVDEAEGDVVEIEIQDTGEGIRPEIADQLGTAFALNAGIAGAKYVEGTGLGMFICKGIVAAHGGTMAIRSATGKGTTVTVRLRAALTDPVSVADDLRIEQDIAA